MPSSYSNHLLFRRVLCNVSFNIIEKTSLKVTVCSHHVTYAFQSESTLYSCLNVKELLARSRLEI